MGTRAGKVVAIAGDRQADVNRGLLCVKGYHAGLALYGEDRLRHPMKRNADGRRRRVLERTLAGEDIGTLVRPSARALSARKHWIAYALRPRGTIQLDAGAVRALRERGRSLLPIGIVGVEGRFGVGDLVRCLSESSEEIARGLSAYSSGELDVIRGHRTSRITEILGYSNGDAVIHRDDLVIL